MSESVLIIGSNSFSGASFAAHLLEKGFNVVGVSRSPEILPVFLPYKWKSHDGSFSFRQLNLLTDIEEIVDIIKCRSINYVVNFAAQGMVAESWKAPLDWYQTNLMSQVALHDALRKVHSLKKYVHVTTPEVYGSTIGWVEESNLFSPSTPYAVSRAACDLHLLSFYRAYEFPVVFTRAANVFGAGQQLYRIIPRTMIAGLGGEKLCLHGDGSSTRSFIDIRDVSRATEAVMLRGKIGDCYHISTTEVISIRGLVSLIAKMMKRDFEDIVQLGEERLGKDQSYMLASEKIRSELDWGEQYSLTDGLQETLAWVTENREELFKQPLNYIHKR